MTVAASLVVEISGRDVNLAALLQRVQAQLQQANTAGTRTAGTLGGTLTTSQERAANSALALAAAYSRLALAEGDPARAASILRTALDSNVGASERLQVSLQATATRLETGRTAFQQFGDAAKGSLLGIVGPAALVATAMGAATKIVASFGEAFKFKAELDATRTAIEAQLHGVRDSGQAFSQAAVFADRYKLTQQEVTQALQASVGIMRQSKSSVEDILGTLARLRVASPEQSLEGAALALKELAGGDITSLVGRFEISRTAANKMKEEIKGGADAVQVLSKYLDGAGIGMNTLETQTKGAMGAMRDLAKAQEDLKLAQAQFAQGPGMAVLSERITLTRGLTNALSGNIQITDEGARGLSRYDAVLAALNGNLGPLIQGQIADAQAKKDQAAATQAFTEASAGATSAINLQSPAMTAAAQAGIYQSGAMILAAQGSIQAADAALLAIDATNAHNAVLQASAEASVVDTAAKNEQAAATQLLTLQTNETVSAFLALNPNIDAAGVAALVTAGKISPLIGQLAAAALQARDATNALIAFNNAANVKSVGATVAQNRAEGRLGRGDSSDSAEMAAAAAPRLRQLESLTKAQEDYDRALGNLGPMRARAQADLQRAKLYGNTEGILKAKTELISLDAEEERLSKKAAGRAKGAGGGAAKLTDQARLNNSLLAQQERADNQAEDAALKHEQRLVDIEDAAYAKRLAASRKYHQDRLDGEAGFYDALGSLGSSGNAKADQELRKSLSARYEAAALKADEIARTRGADAGDAFLEASAAAIQKEGALQDKINKAKQEKNAGEAEYLTGVLALQKKADDARLAQIEADGSAIEAERQKQLSDEDTSYAAAQTRIETASTRATDAKVLNAQRSGKAIDVENLKLQEQEDRLKRIGGAAGGVGGSGATAAPGAGTVPPASAAASPGGGIDLGGAFEALRAAVAGVEAAVRATGGDVTAAQRDTTRAVRGLSNGGGVIS
jgi:hypothetical protein